jgi:hypothetical protein
MAGEYTLSAAPAQPKNLPRISTITDVTEECPTGSGVPGGGFVTPSVGVRFDTNRTRALEVIGWIIR